jgi:hypothetical protein
MPRVHIAHVSAGGLGWDMELGGKWFPVDPEDMWDGVCLHIGQAGERLYLYTSPLHSHCKRNVYPCYHSSSRHPTPSQLCKGADVELSLRSTMPIPPLSRVWSSGRSRQAVLGAAEAETAP